MRDRGLMTLLAGKRKTAVREGNGWTIRLLSAAEVLEARREAEELSKGVEEAALCANACLLARALEKGGRPVFSGGRQVLEQLQVAEIASLSSQWSAFHQAENPSPEDGAEAVDALKKAWSTRHMNGLSGVCSRISGCFRLLRKRRG